MCAPINEQNLQIEELTQMQCILNSTSRGEPIQDLLNRMEHTAQTFLSQHNHTFNDFNAAFDWFSQFGISKFNVVASILNVCREEDLIKEVKHFRDNNVPVMVIFGSGHIRSLDSKFRELS